MDPRGHFSFALGALLAVGQFTACVPPDDGEEPASQEREDALPSGVYRVVVSQGATSIAADAVVATLGEAVAHLAALPASPAPQALEIVVASGEYTGETVSVGDAALKAPLTIRAADLAKKPVFTGAGQRTFLTIAPSARLDVPVTVRGLAVKRYNSAVLFRTQGGSVYQGTRIATGGNVLEDCDITEIGNDYGDGTVLATAAVLVQNVEGAIVRNNRFEDIRSHRVVDATGSHSGALLHAIYVAHWSKGARIEGNTFSGTTGDPIRIRNRSDDVVVERNVFTEPVPAGLAAVSFWFDAADTAPSNLECPNLGARVEYNEVANIDSVLDRAAGQTPQPGCNRPASTFTARRNVDVSLGRCEVTGSQACPTFGLEAGVPRLDFLSQAAQSDAAVCAARDSAYYGSCSSDSTQPFEVYRTAFVSAAQGTAAVSYAGQGCSVEVEACARMAKPSFVPFMDKAETRQDKNLCLARSNTWWSSCKQDDPATPRYARSTYVSGGTSTERIAGHGCLVRANHCPRMGFGPDQVRVDPKASAQTSLNACLSRAATWLGSCTADGVAIPRRIEMMWFQNGALVQSKVVTN